MNIRKGSIMNNNFIGKYNHMHRSSPIFLRRIDPVGCKCKDCTKYGQSIPFDKATKDNVFDMLSGNLEDSSGQYYYATIKGLYNKKNNELFHSVLGNMFVHHGDDVVETFFTYPVGYIISHVDDIRYYGTHYLEDTIGFSDSLSENDIYTEFLLRFMFDRKGEEEELLFSPTSLSSEDEDNIVNELFGYCIFW